MQIESKTAIVIEPFEHAGRKYWAGDVMDIKDEGFNNYRIVRHNTDIIKATISKAELHDHIFLNT